MYILNLLLKSMSLLKPLTYVVACANKVILFAKSSLCENNTFLLKGVISKFVLYPISFKKQPYSIGEKIKYFF